MGYVLNHFTYLASYSLCRVAWLLYLDIQHFSCLNNFKFSSVQLLSHVWLFASPWTAACQASLSITNSQSLLKLMSIESVIPSNHLILCCPLLLLPSIFPSIRVFSNESALHIRWPKYWSFSLPMNINIIFFQSPNLNMLCLHFHISQRII